MKMPKCPKCDEPMTGRCDKGHPHGFDIFKGGADIGDVRGCHEPHFYCDRGYHGLIELFDDGKYEEI